MCSLMGMNRTKLALKVLLEEEEAPEEEQEAAEEQGAEPEEQQTLLKTAKQLLLRVGQAEAEVVEELKQSKMWSWRYLNLMTMRRSCP